MLSSRRNKNNRITWFAVFSTPSGIFASTGSVGLSLMLWVIGKSSLSLRRQHLLGIIDANPNRWHHHIIWTQRLFGVRATDSQVRWRKKLPREGVPTSKIPGDLGLSITNDSTWLLIGQFSGFWEIRASGFRER